MQTANLHESASIALPLIRPDFGGIVAARLIDIDLVLSYSGPAPFGAELDELFGSVALHLQAARRLRFVDSLRLVAAFTDDDADDQDEGAEA